MIDNSPIMARSCNFDFRPGDRHVQMDPANEIV